MCSCFTCAQDLRKLMQEKMNHGLVHYTAMGLPITATADEIKQAYRKLARKLHPDKGGSNAAFNELQTAFEVLIDPKKRAAYDACAADVRFRAGAGAPYSQVQQQDAASTPPPGVVEAMLLQQLLRSRAGSHFDPTKQLCVTCEVCTRPATKQCWTCTMPICDFCTRRQHWKGDVALHWPLVDSPGRMLEQLGKQELEAKRKEDAATYKASLPGYRPQPEMLLLREFQDAIVDLLTARQASKHHQPATGHSRDAAVRAIAAAAPTTTTSSSSSSINGHGSVPLPSTPSFAITATSNSNSVVAMPTSSSKSLAITGSAAINKCFKAWLAADPAVVQQRMSHFDNRLGRFYMWSQTSDSILLAVYMPTGGTSTVPKLAIEATPSWLRLQHHGFAPVVHRTWSKAIDASAEISSWVSTDGHLVTLVVPKAVPGQLWDCCFKGDSHGTRCLQSPYTLLQLPHEVHLEISLPFWVVPDEDILVTLGEQTVTVVVDGVLKLQRTYWREGGTARDSKVVDVPASSWCVLEGQSLATSSAACVVGPLPRQRGNKLLTMTLALPPPTQEEIMYKQGVRQNNASATRNCPHGPGIKGFAFFVEDEDEFGLQHLLQALLFSEAGRTWICPRPWEVANGAAGCATASTTSSAAVAGRWETSKALLPKEVNQHFKWLRTAKAEDGAVNGVAAA